jgi:hypothetical protein
MTQIDRVGVQPEAKYRWYHRVGAVAAAVFCFEVGAFLILFPWGRYWDTTLASLIPAGARPLWLNPYFRGAVSGLGLLNVYISIVEALRLRRFSGPGD